MALDPLAIAIQGLGFDALLVAVQGLLEPETADTAPARAPSPPLGGGRRRRRRDEDEDEALLLMGLV